MPDIASFSFQGVEALEQLFRLLVPRPRRGDRLSPIVRLSGDKTNADGVLTMLGRALGGAVQVSCDAAELDGLPAKSSVAEEGTPGLTDLRRLMRTLCRKLSVDRFDGGTRPLVFRHYRLAEWLMAQTLTSDDEQAELAGLLRRGFPLWGKELLAEVSPVFGPMQRMLIGVAHLLVPEVVFRARISGRIPGVGREFRWFMRQPYLAPRQSHRFLGLARRLTENGRSSELGDQLAKLLVHAFLEDLRLAYRRRPWRWSAARRTSHPVVRLTGADIDPVARFLVLVNEIRNETGRDDPLLIVAAAPGSVPTERTRQARRALHAYERWRDRLPVARQRREVDAWVLSLAVPATVDTDDEPDIFRVMPISPAPRWSRRVTPTAAAAIVVVAALLIWRPWVTAPPASPCAVGGPGQSTWVTSYNDPLRPDPTCVGYSADDGAQGYAFAAQEGQQSQRLVSAEKRVFAQNRAALQLAGKYREQRPLFTLIYFGQLTDLEAYDAESEDIEGLALAQYSGLIANSATSMGSDHRPLLRVILANVGYHIDAGPKVVEQYLKPLISRDRSVVGAVGLDQSRTDTVQMIGDLTAMGIPVVGTSLSADKLEWSSPMYFQLSPSDADIAAMIGEYLATLDVKQVRIYQLPPDLDPANPDLYTKGTADDLVAEVRKRFPASLPVSIRSWTEADAFKTDDGRPICDGVFYYADRDEKFPEFLSALKNGWEGCRPFTGTLIADDSVNRFMAGADLRSRSGLSAPLLYVAKGTLETCRDRTLGLPDDAQFFHLVAPQSGNDDTLPTLLPGTTVPGWNACPPATQHPLGERVALAYGAAEMFDNAVRTLQSPTGNGWSDKIPLTSTAVWGEMREMTEFDTMTGVVSYPTHQTSGRVDHQKWRGLESVKSIADPDAYPTMIFGCGRTSSKDTMDGCRADPLGSRQ